MTLILKFILYFAVNTCSKPIIENAELAPNVTKVDIGSSYTITCEKNYAISGERKMTCTDTEKFDRTPSCTG